jgi:hypothetical protein
MNEVPLYRGEGEAHEVDIHDRFARRGERWDGTRGLCKGVNRN